MNKEKEKAAPERPLCLKLEDAKAEIFSAVAMAAKRHQVPFYLLESIVIDAARQVSDAAKKEREAAASDYERQLAMLEKGEGDNGK